MLNFRSNKVICFGEVLWDILPSGPVPGGAPMNVAIHLKRQGMDPIMISRVGNDKKGKKLINFLNDSGIDTKYIQIDKKFPTSKVLIHLDQNRNATYEICESVAWDYINYSDSLKELICCSGIIVYGSLASRNIISRDTLTRLLDNKVLKFFDVNLRPPFNSKAIINEFLMKSDIVKMNEEELFQIAKWYGVSGKEKEIAEWIFKVFELKMICITKGENGAILFAGEVFYEHSGYKVDIIDTVGAGDAFLASLISSIIKKDSLEKALDQACAIGAYVASCKGAVPEYYPRINFKNIVP